MSVKIENSDHFFTLIPRNEIYISGSKKLHYPVTQKSLQIKVETKTALT